jgi:hypothetical protein
MATTAQGIEVGLRAGAFFIRPFLLVGLGLQLEILRGNAAGEIVTAAEVQADTGAARSEREQHVQEHAKANGGPGQRYPEVPSVAVHPYRSSIQSANGTAPINVVRTMNPLAMMASRALATADLPMLLAR